ncbi:MAG: YeeE/YedE thiosulfate transporter family protein [Alphaproteobacteria bacterium]|nr:YeeE/YedE thiosulfate transporter family protein [Alphaproteobacteria bacterium]
MIEDAWIMGFAGGLLIGCAAALMLLVNGRIAGVSGILGRLLPPWGTVGDRLVVGPAVLFALGLILAPLLLRQAGFPLAISVTDSLPVLLIGGVLVGYGTRLGSGCTSGHGVCGLSRGSPRSMAAVAVFMAVAALTTSLVRLTTGAVQ